MHESIERPYATPHKEAMAWSDGGHREEKHTPAGRPRAERSREMHKRRGNEDKSDREALISQIMQRLRRMTADELEQELWHLERY